MRPLRRQNLQCGRRQVRPGAFCGCPPKICIISTSECLTRSPCRPLTSVNVDVGITLAGSGVSAAAINSAAVLFPLRLGFACAIGVPLQTVAVTDVSNIIAGAVVASYPVSATDAVNVRTAPCPEPVNLTRRLNGESASDCSLRGHSGAPLRAAPRVAYVATSGTALANGSYVLVHISVSVAVPASAASDAASNVSSITAVARVVTAAAQLLPTSTGNTTAGSVMLNIAYGSFLAAAAAATGVNVSELVVGSAGAPAASVSQVRSNPAPSVGSSGPTALSAGAIAGIVVAVLLIACLIILCCCVVLARRGHKEAPSKDLARADGEVVPSKTNPMHAPPQKGPQSAATPASEPQSGGSSGCGSNGNTLPIVLNPMLAQRGLRSVSLATCRMGALVGVPHCQWQADTVIACLFPAFSQSQMLPEGAAVGRSTRSTGP